MLGYFDQTFLSDITFEDAMDYKNHRLKETSSKSVYLELCHLKMLLNFSIGRGLGVNYNVLNKVIMQGLEKPSKRVRYLTKREFALLHDTAQSPGIKLALLMGVLTGMRSGELSSLDWGDVDLEEDLIMIRGEVTKTNTQRIIPISPELKSALLDTRKLVPHCNNDPVLVNGWGKRYNRLNGTIKELCVRVGLRDVSAHILRHTFASWQLQSGVEQLVVQTILGHTSASMTARYAHANMDLMRKAMSTFRAQSEHKR